ncbi:hypothetical protein [Paenibacillus faecis]|uniref:hypothetical protein n=1 Tax=Paenibacillus faecis TaxID=862114 RepID=UPI00147884D8|nr:hypothetical protein [Paenibacillus faecis]
MDFTKMKFGVIQHEGGLIIVIEGEFLGPYDGRQVKKIIQILEGELHCRKS